YDAQEFIRRLNAQSTVQFRLPTEAEWEYACRSGGKDEPFAGGEDIQTVGWYNGNNAGTTQRVGSKPANGLGLHDMTGNVAEFVQDGYDKHAYAQHAAHNPLLDMNKSRMIARGGPWRHGGTRLLRCQFRQPMAPDVHGFRTGVRLARDP
ncbi:MAG: formylglycine-generating enzyme family protein, partial [Magnetococcus sp. XQGC-1]